MWRAQKLMENFSVSLEAENKSFYCFWQHFDSKVSVYELFPFLFGYRDPRVLKSS